MKNWIALGLLSALVLGAAELKQDGKAWQATGAHYAATVAEDGCLTSLRVDGEEFLAPGVAVSRGIYFFEGGTQKLPALASPEANVLVATGTDCELRYTFTDEGLTVAARNGRGKPAKLFAVLPAGLSAMRDEAGKIQSAPRKADDQTSAWFRGGACLEIAGTDRLWPWEQSTQVCEANVPAGESRELRLVARSVTAGEQAALAPLQPAGVIRRGDYEASVGTDGCLESLKVKGKEFLDAKVNISRGLYLYQGGLVPLKVTKTAADSITAESDRAALVYTFSAEAIRVAATNRTDKEMPIYLVLQPGANSVIGPDGKAVAPVVGNNWGASTWLCQGMRLRIEGTTRLWGPWNDRQICEMLLAPKASRELVLLPGTATAAEAAASEQLVAGPPAGPLTILSPRELQVIQRYSRERGVVFVSGRVRPDLAADTVQVRVTGGKAPADWQKLAYVPASHSFSGHLDLPAGGWYKLEVRSMQGGKEVAAAAVAQFGIGEVFVGAGQSNSTNYGQERTQSASGMVSSFDGTGWRLANDPQPGTHDRSSGGSFWPAFGDAMYGRFQVPIGVATTGHGGTSVNSWQPNGDLFRWTMTRINQLGPGGFRALLWHQGEADVGMASDEYARKLRTVIEASKAEAGWEFPWFVAQVSYHNPEHPSFDSTRIAQQKLWDEGVALRGPDTDTLVGDARDHDGRGIHFSPKGLSAHGLMWAQLVGDYLDTVLGQ